MPTNIDQLQIEVETKSEGAIAGLKDLKKVLQSLNRIGKSSGLDDLSVKLEKISKIRFNNLKQLNALGHTLNQVNKLTKDVKDLSSKMSDIPTNVDVSANTGDMAATASSFDSTNKNATTFNKTLSKTRSAAKSATKGVRSLKGGLDETSSSFRKTTKKASELSKVLKIVLVYGGAFRAVTMLTQGVSEGLQNVAQYNNETATAMNRLSTMSLYLKNAMGAALYPVIVALTPALQTLTNGLVKAMEVLSQFVAILSGKSTYLKAKEYMKSYVDNAKKSANEVKKSFAGMDEITVIGQKDSGASGAGTDNPAEMFEEAEITDSMRESLNEVLRIVELIGAAFAAWTISKAIINGVEWLKSIRPENFTWSFSILGATMFIADLDALRKYLDDIHENGFNFTNVTGALSEFAGLIGDALLILGNLKWAGALKAVQGIGEIVSGISDISKNGANVENVITVVRGLSNIGIAIGLFTGNLKLAGVFVAIQGFTSVIGEISKNWEAIKKGDWSGVDKATLIIGVIEIFGGIITALGAFSKIKGKVNIGKSTADMDEVATATETIDKTTSKLTGKLKSLVKNLALGIVVIAEIAVAAGLFIGAIWGIGVLLEQVGKAWQPVIDNGKTVSIAVGIGTGILVAVGVATGLLGGTAGTTLIANLGLGIATLTLLGVSAGLFLAEILVIGKLLDEIGKAWTPVLDNGETIAKAIGIGTGLLIGIGVVTAALGVATVASAGLLPAAIGLGTALLVELTAAFKVFCDSLIDVAEKLIDLSEPLDDLNEILPGLRSDMDSYTSFMGDFAKAVVAFTLVNAIAGIAATIDKVIDFFTTDPVKRMDDEVRDQIGEFKSLITALEIINPLIDKATKLVGDYKDKMGSFESATGGSGGFLNSIVRGAKGVINGLISMFEGMANGVIKGVNALIRGLNKIKITLPAWVPEHGGKSIGFNINQISSVSLPRFATGGFPEDGLFMANHGELVGKFSNGKTAVANNEQIVAGITGGVYAANQEQNALLREQNKLLRQLVETKSNGQIDVTTITSAMQRKNRRDGKTIVPVGV